MGVIKYPPPPLSFAHPIGLFQHHVELILVTCGQDGSFFTPALNIKGQKTVKG